MRAIRRALSSSLAFGLALCAWAQQAPAQGGSASLWGGTEQGDFRPGYGTSHLWSAGAQAQGFVRQNKAFYEGSFLFRQDWGKDMMLSMFTQPGYYPIDALEFTPGDKVRQTYGVAGGLEYAFTPEWTLGGHASYNVINFSKRKDLRHTTYALSLEVEPLVRWTVDSGSWELRYLFRRKAETVTAEQVGTATANSYYAFLDKGLDYGVRELWDGAGTHLAEAGVSGLPVQENAHGLGLSYTAGRLKIGLEGRYLQGLVGEKGYNWMRFPGWEARLTVAVPLGAGSWNTSFQFRADRLEEAILDRVSTGGVVLPEIYGYNAVSLRRHGNLVSSYVLPLKGVLQRLSVREELMFWDDASFLVYPYMDRCFLLRWYQTAELQWKKGNWGWQAGISTTLGGKKEQGLDMLADSLPNARPYRLVTDWNRKTEYLTAPSVGVQAGVRRYLPLGLAVAFKAGWVQAFGLQYLTGNYRFNASLHLEYAF